MATNTMMDWQGDPLASDALPANCYLLMATSKYSGTYRQIIVPASPNYPAGTPTRYVAYLPGFPFVDGGHAMTVYDSTSSVSLTAVNTSPGTNQYYNPIKGPGTNYPTNTTKEPDFIEFNSGQAGHTIDFTFYAIGSVLHAVGNDVATNTLTTTSDVTVGGNLSVTNGGNLSVTNINMSGSINYGLLTSGNAGSIALGRAAKTTEIASIALSNNTGNQVGGSQALRIARSGSSPQGNSPWSAQVDFAGDHYSTYNGMIAQRITTVVNAAVGTSGFMSVDYILWMVNGSNIASQIGSIQNIALQQTAADFSVAYTYTANKFRMTINSSTKSFIYTVSSEMTIITTI